MRKILSFRNLLKVVFIIAIFLRDGVRDYLMMGCVATWLIANAYLYIAPKIKPLIDKAKVKILEKKLAYAYEGNNKVVEFESEPDLEEDKKEPEVVENNILFKDSQDFLLRNVNFRITEKLKKYYSKATWVWESDIKDIGNNLKCARIKTTDTGDYNMADVTFCPTGEIKFRMIKTHDLNGKEGDENQQMSLDDVQTWYETFAFGIINNTISEISSQGHRFLEITEDGKIMIREQNQNVEYKKIDNMPEKKLWTEFIKFLKKDDIKAKILNDKLVLSWGGNA